MNDRPRLDAEREAEIRHRLEYLGPGFERLYLGDVLSELDAARGDLALARRDYEALLVQHDGDRKMLRLALNAQQRRAEQAEAQAAEMGEALETFADLGQLVLDRITNGATNEERYVMKDTARLAMEAYAKLVAAPAAAPTTERGAALLRAVDAVLDAAPIQGGATRIGQRTVQAIDALRQLRAGHGGEA